MKNHENWQKYVIHSGEKPHFCQQILSIHVKIIILTNRPFCQYNATDQTHI